MCIVISIWCVFIIFLNLFHILKLLITIWCIHVFVNYCLMLVINFLNIIWLIEGIQIFDRDFDTWLLCSLINMKLFLSKIFLCLIWVWILIISIFFIVKELDLISFKIKLPACISITKLVILIHNFFLSCLLIIIFWHCIFNVCFTNILFITFFVHFQFLIIVIMHKHFLLWFMSFLIYQSCILFHFF